MWLPQPASLVQYRTAADTEVEGQANDTTGQFETMILKNLKTAGVQNRIKQERLKFDRLETFAGTCLHAAGEHTENGKSKRVAVYIGPQYGTVSPEEVKEAVKEAMRCFLTLDRSTQGRNELVLQ